MGKESLSWDCSWLNGCVSREIKALHVSPPVEFEFPYPVSNKKKIICYFVLKVT